MSIKPVSSLSSKRDCFTGHGSEGSPDSYTPEQIIHAYDAYAKAYWIRNADDKKLAKGLIRWLRRKEGSEAFADRPMPPSLLGHDSKPLAMEELADADPVSASLWNNKLKSAHCIVLSLMIADKEERPSQEELDAACDEDEQFQRCLAKCKERYGELLGSSSYSARRARGY